MSKKESIDDLFKQLNTIVLTEIISLLPNLDNKQLQNLVNAVVTECKKRKETIWT